MFVCLFVCLMTEKETGRQTFLYFNGLFSRKTWVNRHKKVKPIYILMKQEMMGWQ